RAEPDRAVLRFADEIDLGFALRCVRAKCSALHAKEAGRSSREEAAIPRFIHAEEGDIGQVKRFVDSLELFRMAPVEAAIRRGPDIAISILDDSHHELVGEALMGTERAEAAIAVVEEATTIGGDPQAAVVAHGEAADVVVRHGGSVEARVDNEADTVKAG